MIGTHAAELDLPISVFRSDDSPVVEFFSLSRQARGPPSKFMSISSSGSAAMSETHLLGAENLAPDLLEEYHASAA